jgi:hypothetical protein
LDGDVSDSTLSTWKAGAAKAVITPTKPMWLAGWAVRREPSRGTISDLFCRALSLEAADGKRVVIVAVDLISIEEWLVRPVALEIEKRYGIKQEQLIFCASHTHCGPEIRPDKVYFFEIPEEWADNFSSYTWNLQETMIRVISESIERLQPAQISFANAEATFAQNRRNAAGPHDWDVPVLDVRDANGRHLAICFGYACHNLTLDPQDRRYCADWSGFAAEQLDQSYPGAVALFLTGAGADQDPHPRGTLELAKQHGQVLADAIQAVLRTPRETIAPTIKLAGEAIMLPLKKISSEQLAADLQSSDRPVRRKAEWLVEALRANQVPSWHKVYHVEAIEFGNRLLLIAMGCEPVVDWSLNLKREFADRSVWVAGYCNEMFAYIPTRRVQDEGGYEGGRATLWSSTLGPFEGDVEQRVLEGVRAAVAAVHTKECK